VKFITNLPSKRSLERIIISTFFSLHQSYLYEFTPFKGFNNIAVPSNNLKAIHLSICNIRNTLALFLYLTSPMPPQCFCYILYSVWLTHNLPFANSLIVWDQPLEFPYYSSTGGYHGIPNPLIGYGYQFSRLFLSRSSIKFKQREQRYCNFQNFAIRGSQIFSVYLASIHSLLPRAYQKE